MTWTPEFTLQVFRSLGGKAENITFRETSDGFRVVPVDPRQPVKLIASENLIVPVADIEFRNGELKISEGANTGKSERTFLENYFDTFSWGAGGRKEALLFENGRRELPADVKTFMSEVLGIAAMSEEPGDPEVAAERWFLESRQTDRAPPVLVPILDLIRHDPQAKPLQQMNGVGLSDSFENEVRALRAGVSPMGAFLRFGASLPERAVFSLPLIVEIEGGQLEIGSQIRMTSRICSFPAPDFDRDVNHLRLSGLMIGNAVFPRVPRSVFRHMLKSAGREQAEADETFDRIQHRNRMAFLELLDVLEAHEGGLIPGLRRAARHQLQAMSWCIGARDL